jgi:hypothetical protein
VVINKIINKIINKMILLIGYVMISLMILLTIFYLHNKHIQQLKDFEEDNKKTINELISKVTNQSEKDETILNDLKSGLKNLKDTVISNKSTIESVSKNIKSNTIIYDGITESIKTNKNRLDNITEKVTTNKNHLINLQTKMNDNSNKLDTIVTNIGLLLIKCDKKDEGDDIIERLLTLYVPTLLNRPMIMNLLSPILNSILIAIRDHSELSLISNDLTKILNDNLDIILKNVNIETIFNKLEPCMEILFKELSGQSESEWEKEYCMNKFTKDKSYWYSIYKSIHENIKNEHMRIKFPEYKIMSDLLNESDYKIVEKYYKIIKDLLRLIRNLTEEEMSEIFSLYPYNLKAFSIKMLTETIQIFYQTDMSKRYETPVLNDNFMNSVLETMRDESLNLKQTDLGYDEGYIDGMYDGRNDIDINYRVDESKTEYYKSGYIEGYDDGHYDGRNDGSHVENEMDSEESRDVSHIMSEYVIEGFSERSFYNI